MTTTCRLSISTALAALVGLALVAGPARAQAQKSDVKLPDVVKKTFDAKFPGAKVDKIDAEEEEGVMVYDIEFRDGNTEKEADIAADGTLLEFTVVITAKEVPAAAMASIRKAAVGATMGRVERIEISYETKAGKVVKLPAPVTHYAVELTKGGKEAEIVVDSAGKVLEAPEWK
jgi:uncharacterized membrane protein YkoI